ncbi:hypothetical protein MXL15_25030 [Pseudomonas mosselii]|uniref:hypothetical protein n=1 Tax=Pseudomonas mosselii TaxID=78327 RepID=UPI002DB59E71|nr:hypothetical protein [Pseudomonas mosselii]MEB5935457.1 hypothetical protein [Pseudomonas mosselii]
MFLTYQHAKIDQFSLFGEDPATWSYVEHNIHMPWFYVATHEQEQDGDFMQHPMLMLSNDQLLQSLVSDQESGLRVESVQLVTPDHVNHAGRWMMEPLESILRFKSEGGTAYVYRVLGDRTYVYGDAEIALEGACYETIFSTSMLHDSAQE